jgi:hypothetical protein
MLKTASSIINAIGALNYAGTWDANANNPTLTSGVGTKGNYYIVSVAGTTTLDGISLWSVGDWAVFNGSVWEKVNGATSESFVNLTVTGTANIATGNVTNLISSNVSITGGNVGANLSTSTSVPVANATGTLATGNGGTGLTSFTNAGVLYASSTSALSTSSSLTFDGANLGVAGKGYFGTSTRAYATSFGSNALFSFGDNTSGNPLFVAINNTQYNTVTPIFQFGISSDGTNVPSLNISASNRPGNIFIDAGNETGGGNIFFGSGTTYNTIKATLFSSGGFSLGNSTDPGATNLSVTGTVTANSDVSAKNLTAAPAASSSPSPKLYMSGSEWNSNYGPVGMSGYLQVNSLVINNTSPTSKVSVYAGGNGATPTEVAYFGSDGNYSNKQTSSPSATASQIVGNANAQGTATWRTVVRQVPVVTLGTQLIIPFFSQGTINSSTIIRITGCSSIYNFEAAGYGFSAYIGVGHLTSISVASWGLGGNIASVTTSGMNVILNFTNNYTHDTADGVFICLEYMCGTVSQSIDVANIVMN